MIDTFILKKGWCELQASLGIGLKLVCLFIYLFRFCFVTKLWRVGREKVPCVPCKPMDLSLLPVGVEEVLWLVSMSNCHRLASPEEGALPEELFWLPEWFVKTALCTVSPASSDKKAVTGCGLFNSSLFSFLSCCSVSLPCNLLLPIPSLVTEPAFQAFIVD